MTVIANDFVPIQPYKTNVLNIAMNEPDICFTKTFYAKYDLGQRYNVIVKVDQVSIAKNFWLRATPQNACSENANPTNVKGIIYYGDSPSTPSTTGYSYTDSCVDEDISNLSLIVSETVSSPFYNKSEPVSLAKMEAIITGGSSIQHRCM
jgi:hypothetical protein